MMFTPNRSHRVWKIIVSIFVGSAMVVAIGVFFLLRSDPVSLLQNSFFRGTVETLLPEKETTLLTALPTLLGIDVPKTYLVLFENNTELRPAGGFIGAYAVVRVSNGHPEILVVEGTEILDGRTPADWRPTPPAPITEHLGVDRWYVRDANWSPDFSASAKKILELYAGEQGPYAEDIDAVVAFTPTVLEAVLEHTGPVTVHGIEFTKDNVIERLEYEVEYGFKDKGITTKNRKYIIAPFFLSLIAELDDSIFLGHEVLLTLVGDMTKQKHIFAYSDDLALQHIFDSLGWDGRVPVLETGEDTLLWVDANLAALKTDHAVGRHLHYALQGKQGNRYLAKATMTYTHTGTFDWRTTRYLTYARVFAPKGAEFVSVQGKTRGGAPIATTAVESGMEDELSWFGTFFSIEPGEQKSLSFLYLLPESVSEAIDRGEYHLVVPKQLGTIAHRLTLDLQFATTVTAAIPAEEPAQFGDDRYEADTDLLVDREFLVSF